MLWLQAIPGLQVDEVHAAHACKCTWSQVCSWSAVSLSAVPGVSVAPVLSDSQQMSLDKAAVIVWGYREPQLRDCSRPQQGSMKLAAKDRWTSDTAYTAIMSLCTNSLVTLSAEVSPQQTTPALVSLIARSPETSVSWTASHCGGSSCRELQQARLTHISLSFWNPSTTRQTPDRNLKRICGGLLLKNMYTNRTKTKQQRVLMPSSSDISVSSQPFASHPCWQDTHGVGVTFIIFWFGT